MSKKFWNDNEFDINRFEVNSRIVLIIGIIILITTSIVTWLITK